MKAILTTRPHYTVREAYRGLIHRLKKHSGRDVVLACCKFMNQTEPQRIDRLKKYEPWLLLLMCELAFEHCEWDKYKPTAMSPKNFNRLVNWAKDLDGACAHKLDRENIYMYLRAKANQEFLLQGARSWAGYLRELVLFASLSHNDHLQTAFKADTQLWIEEWIELSVMLVTRFITDHKRSVSRSWFSTVEEELRPGTLDAFLSAISLTPAQAHDRVTSGKTMSPIRRLHLLGPLVECPLLKIGDDYLCYHSNLLVGALQTSVYDRLRQLDSQRFMDRFGRIYEDYVATGLDSMNLSYHREEKLKHVLTHCDSKCVDFWVTEGKTQILVEAKGVRLGDTGKVSLDRNVVHDRICKSVGRALEQVRDTLTALIDKGLISPQQADRREIYALIVTYDVMYLGNSTILFEEIAPELGRLIDGLIPLENVIVTSIEDFDLLSGAVGNGEAYFSTTLADCANVNRIGSSFLPLHDVIVDTCPNPPMPDHISRASQAFVKRASSRFQNS